MHVRDGVEEGTHTVLIVGVKNNDFGSTTADSYCNLKDRFQYYSCRPGFLAEGQEWVVSHLLDNYQIVTF